MSSETVLYESHPAMFRNQPVYFILCAILCVVGVGIVLLVAWWLRTLSTTLVVTTEKTMLRRGIFSKFENEVYHENVRNVQTRQTFFQRMMGVGYIGISSSGQAGMEIEVNGIPDPDRVKDLIAEHREDT